MKANVDLTLNRMFRDKRSSTENLLSAFVNPFPWNRYTRRLFSNNEITKKKAEIFFTGDREDRERKKASEIFEMIYMHECDCCGRYINKFPWECTETLCKDCDEMLEKSMNKFPWSKRRNR